MTTSISSLGIWGLGITGKAAVTYFSKQNYHLSAFDSRTLSAEELAFLAQHNVQLFTDLPTFLTHNEKILPSAGIDLRPYAEHHNKFLNELDIFYGAWHKPIIAVTGSVGKTSVTHLLNEILTKLDRRVALGGNIGIGMLSLLDMQKYPQHDFDYALLEVSSFQLERAKQFAPTLALWTNLVPNHLDQHGTMDAYTRAKAQIYLHQKPNCLTLLGLGIREQLPPSLVPHHPTAYFSTTVPTQAQRALLKKDDVLFYIDNGTIVQEQSGLTKHLIDCSKLPACSFTENWLAIIGALTLLNIPLDKALAVCDHLTLPEHRLEKVATINGVSWYNDSKSTTPTSTLAALAQLSKVPTHLFLGGLGKGIDRTPLIKALPHDVVTVYCFGKEAETLHQLCKEQGKKSYACATLQDAFAACLQNAQPHQTVLFSPSGSSYDLFKNFEERGTVFKQLVLEQTRHKGT